MTEDLPIELECFLLKYGFFENDKMPGAHLHAPVKIKEKQPVQATGWVPEYDGQPPPF